MSISFVYSDLQENTDFVCGQHISINGVRNSVHILESDAEAMCDVHKSKSKRSMQMHS